jgi:hypothetical protein
MNPETIEGWVKIYETYDYMQSELIEAKLNDEGIEYQIMNKADIGYTMDLGNSDMGRSAVNMPFKFFVKPEDGDKALKLINEDKSAMLDDPNIDFDEPTDKT